MVYIKSKEFLEIINNDPHWIIKWGILLIIVIIIISSSMIEIIYNINTWEVIKSLFDV